MAKKKQPRRKFYESTFVVTVLSEDAPIDAHLDLEELQKLLAHGETAGGWTRKKVEKRSRRIFAKKVQSSPYGFMLNAWGIDRHGDDLPVTDVYDKESAK
jgi:hypothetical protein